MMLRAIAIDDEPLALQVLQEWAKSSSLVDLQACFTEPIKAIDYLDTHKNIDLLLLDIEMAQVNGLSLAKTYAANKLIVFTTAYPDFALDGFELDVVDYLLKPIAPERFHRAIHKAAVVFEQRQVDHHKQLLSNKKISPGSDDFIFVKVEYKVIKVRLDEIKFIEGAGNYIAIYTTKGKLLTLQNMKTFEEYLAPFTFIRIHKSYIISAKFIDGIEANMIIIGDKKLTIGEHYRESFYAFLDQISKQF